LSRQPEVVQVGTTSATSTPEVVPTWHDFVHVVYSSLAALLPQFAFVLLA